MARQPMSETDFRTPGKTKGADPNVVKRSGTSLPLIGYIDAMPKDKSLYALLFCAAAIDGRLHGDEIAEVNALAVRTTTLGNASTKALQKMQEEIEAELGDELKVMKLAEKASRAFRRKPKRAASAFMHALDILFADRDLTDREKTFVKQLADFLQIPPAKASAYVDVLMTKNEH
ncbi:MAG: TerB family tellurite resistance protein [Hyphomonadaceae bacterium]